MNSNGRELLNFLVSNSMFACNTAFKHKAAHTTTRIGYSRDWSKPKNANYTKPYYRQIDYILCRTRSKCLLNDARSYGGCKTVPDHKIVRSKIDFSKMFLINSNKRRASRKFDCSKLTSCKDTQSSFRSNLKSKLSVIEYDNQ